LAEGLQPAGCRCSFFSASFPSSWLFPLPPFSHSIFNLKLICTVVKQKTKGSNSTKKDTRQSKPPSPRSSGYQVPTSRVKQRHCVWCTSHCVHTRGPARARLNGDKTYTIPLSQKHTAAAQSLAALFLVSLEKSPGSCLPNCLPGLGVQVPVWTLGQRHLAVLSVRCRKHHR
jgi:hypothetical protein